VTSALQGLNGRNPPINFPDVLPKVESEAISLLLPVCIELLLLGKPLAALPVMRRWPRVLKSAWTRARQVYAPILRDTIDAWEREDSDTNGLKLLQAFIGLMALMPLSILPHSNLICVCP
jgi:hypothetical protein